MQRARRRDPYPFSWEVPASVLGVFVLVVVLAAQTGRALANLTAGAGWTWPGDEDVVTSFPAVLAGDAAAGLAPGPGGYASPALLWTWLTLTQLLALAAMIWVARAGLARWGPGRVRGVATRAETETLLGVKRLRKVAPVVRPDLHSRARGWWR